MKKSGKKPKASASEPVTFEQFFIAKVQSGRLKPWQRAEISWFFRDQKLRDKEDLEVYENALKRY